MKVNILETVSGDTEAIPIRAINPANDQPIDISSNVLSEIIITMKDKKGRKLIEKKLTTGGIVLDASVIPAGSNGLGNIIILDRDTYNLKNIYKYDLQVTRVSGVISTPVTSFWNIKEDMTS